MTLTPRRVPLDFLAASVGGEILERRSRIRGARRRGLLSPQVIETRHRYMTGARGDGETAVSDVVFDTRRVLAGALFCCVPGQRVDGHDLAGAVYENPSRRMDLVGVTGTNGKTTTTFVLEAIFRAAGLVPGVIGTVEVHIGDSVLPVVHTTPEAPDLQRLLAEMADSGVQAAAMEVSSHGLALGRVDATRFRAAIFTNLTQDHLDFHRDLEDYYQAKRRLLTPAFTGVGIVNTDDPFGRRLAVEAAGAGIDLDTAAAGLAGLAGVPGRFERVDEGQPFTVLVDYAHTPDSLENVLRAARAVTHGRVLVVFGCGGDRDRAKRPLMGEIAGKLADLAVVTSDNPRSEPPEAIVAQIVEGVRRSAGPDRYHVEVDRRAAIRHTLALARPGDAVLIAGKGHEQGQEFESGRKVPFDDRVVAAEELRALRSKGGAP